MKDHEPTGRVQLGSTGNDYLDLQTTLNKNTFVGSMLSDSYTSNKDNHLQNIKMKLHNHVVNEDPSFSLNKMYFTDQPSSLYVEETDQQNSNMPMAYLVEPYARKNTEKSRFDMPPCSGGVKGKSKYLAQPGEKTNVQWIIQNPVSGGRCKVKLSRGHPDDIASYHSLPVAGHGYDSRTGSFECGEPNKSIEEAVVQLPIDTVCDECTLQWIYEAPKYGSLFQCSDISIIAGKEGKVCNGECKNGGVCQDGLCYCAAGYFGEYCTHRGKVNQFYEPVSAEGKPAPEPAKEMQFEDESNGGLGFFGWYFIILLIALVITAIVLALIWLL